MRVVMEGSFEQVEVDRTVALAAAAYVAISRGAPPDLVEGIALYGFRRDLDANTIAAWATGAAHCIRFGVPRDGPATWFTTPPSTAGICRRSTPSSGGWCRRPGKATTCKRSPPTCSVPSSGESTVREKCWDRRFACSAPVDRSSFPSTRARAGRLPGRCHVPHRSSRILQRHLPRGVSAFSRLLKTPSSRSWARPMSGEAAPDAARTAPGSSRRFSPRRASSCRARRASNGRSAARWPSTRCARETWCFSARPGTAFRTWVSWSMQASGCSFMPRRHGGWCGPISTRSTTGCATPVPGG